MSKALPAGNPGPTTKPLERGPAAAAAARAKPFQHQSTILAALDIQVPPTEVPAGYGFAMAALAGFLVFITAAYLGLVAFLAYLLVWHVWQTFASFQYGPFFLFHVPMALLGGLLLLFLIKPVFFRPKKGQSAFLTLKPEDEPLLFAFVNKLCEATGARRPSAIEVDCEANAGARLRRQGLTAAVGKDLILRVGLPLAAGMSVRQFAGVLAHELGHFNQKTGMKGSLLVRLLIAFFAKIVFERDRLDEKLHRMRNSQNALGRIIFWAAAWLVEAARGVLWLMMIVGELLTCGVLRRMEYDADRVEAHVAGCKDFLVTGKLMLFLNIAARRARFDLADAWEQRRLADDLPRLIVAHARQLAEHKKDILKLLGSEKTSWFDTHPCHNDRVAAVNATGAQGLVACELPAKHLFRDFAAVCKEASRTLYRSLIGEELDKGKLVPTAELVEQRLGERESFRALRRFYRDGAAMTRPILPTADALRPADRGREQALIEKLVASRRQMLDLAPIAAGAAEQFEASKGHVMVARAQAGLASFFHSDAANKLGRAANLERTSHEPLKLKAVRDLTPFEQIARQRLTVALRLAQTSPWAEDPTGAGDPKNIDAKPGTPTPGRSARTVARLVRVCQLLEPMGDHIEKLRDNALAIRILMGAYDDQNPYPPLVTRILRLCEETLQTLDVIHGSLKETAYPFAHATHGISIADALLPRRPDPKDPVDVHAASHCVVDRYYDLLYRALAELTQHAERIERGVGMEMLCDLPPKRNEEADDEERKEERRNTRRYWLGYGGRALGGMALLFLLVSLSVSPPSLPSWGGGGSGASSSYRPAGFTFSPRAYRSDYYYTRPQGGVRPGYPNPNPNPYAPPVRQPRVNPNPYDPNPYTPRTPPGVSRPGSPYAPSGGRNSGGGGGPPPSPGRR